MHAQSTYDFLTNMELLLWLVALGAAALARAHRVFPALIWLLGFRLTLTASYNWFNRVYANQPGGHAQSFYFRYYCLYWLLYFGATVSSFFSIEQLLRNAFAPLAGLAKLSILVFRFTGALTLFIALTAHLPVEGPIPVLKWVQALCISFLLCVCVFEVTLISLLFAYARRLGLSLRNRILGIAIGFFIFGLADVVSLVADLNHEQPSLLLVSEVATFAAVLLWTAYLLLPEYERGPLALKPSSPLMRWNEIVSQLGGGSAVPQPGASFMSEVESIVERIMVRNADRTI